MNILQKIKYISIEIINKMQRIKLIIMRYISIKKSKYRQYDFKSAYKIKLKN